MKLRLALTLQSSCPTFPSAYREGCTATPTQIIYILILRISAVYKDLFLSSYIPRTQQAEIHLSLDCTSKMIHSSKIVEHKPRKLAEWW